MTDDPQSNADHRVGRSGIVVVVLAVLVGVVLLATAYGDSRSAIDAPAKEASATTIASTTTTTLAGRPAAEVKVKVVNATNVTGLATRTRDTLLARGYTQVSVGDSQNIQERTSVYYQPGFEAEGQNVAKALGLSTEIAQPLPDPPPASIGEANVLVMAGLDL